MPEEGRDIQIKEQGRKRKSIYQYILAGIVVALLIVLGILYLYVENVTLYFSPDDELYYANVDGFDTYIRFSDGEMGQYSFSYLDEERELRYTFGKATYDCTGYRWKKFIPPFYFSENRFFSLTNVQGNARPVTIVLSCEGVKAFDWFYKEIDTSGLNMIGQSAKLVIYFYDDSMLMDGTLFQKSEDFPDGIKEDVVFLDESTNVN